MNTNTFFFGDLPINTIGEYWSEANEFFLQHFRSFGTISRELVHYKLFYCNDQEDVLMQQCEITTPLARLIPEHFFVSVNEPARPYFKLQMLYDQHHLQYLYFHA